MPLRDESGYKTLTPEAVLDEKWLSVISSTNIAMILLCEFRISSIFLDHNIQLKSSEQFLKYKSHQSSEFIKCSLNKI